MAKYLLSKGTKIMVSNLNWSLETAAVELAKLEKWTFIANRDFVVESHETTTLLVLRFKWKNYPYIMWVKKVLCHEI